MSDLAQLLTEWRVQYELGIDEHGRAAIVGVSITPRGDTPERGLSRRLLREVPINASIEAQMAAIDGALRQVFDFGE